MQAGLGRGEHPRPGRRAAGRRRCARPVVKASTRAVTSRDARRRRSAGATACSLRHATTAGSAALEVGLTAALARYASDLAHGEVDPRRVNVLWRLRPRAFEVPAGARRRPRPFRDSPTRCSHPVRPGTSAIPRASRRRSPLREPWPAPKSGVPLVPAAPRLRPGTRGPQVRDVARPSRLLGRSRGGGIGRRLRPCHGGRTEAVPGTARPGPRTSDGSRGGRRPQRLRADRVGQILLNLERWRWQDRPAASASSSSTSRLSSCHAYDGGREALSMRVITGTPDTPTPVFDQAMTSVVFSPYWNVPVNITLDETLPAVARDRGYLRRMNLEVLRGDGGAIPRHRLGRATRRPSPSASARDRAIRSASVKFNIANPFNVYLHDTPNDALFLRARRTLSHGCVRLREAGGAGALGARRRDGMDAARIAAAMRAGRESAVTARRSDPGLDRILSRSGWTRDGTVQFRSRRLPARRRHRRRSWTLPRTCRQAGIAVAAAG